MKRGSQKGLDKFVQSQYEMHLLQTHCNAVLSAARYIHFVDECILPLSPRVEIGPLR
jgi:hypothetical protein